MIIKLNDEQGKEIIAQAIAKFLLLKGELIKSAKKSNISFMPCYIRNSDLDEVNLWHIKSIMYVATKLIQNINDRQGHGFEDDTCIWCIRFLDKINKTCGLCTYQNSHGNCYNIDSDHYRLENAIDVAKLSNDKYKEILAESGLVKSIK